MLSTTGADPDPSGQTARRRPKPKRFSTNSGATYILAFILSQELRDILAVKLLAAVRLDGFDSARAVLDQSDNEAYDHLVVRKSDGTAHCGHLLNEVVRPTREVIVVESAKHFCKTRPIGAGHHVARVDVIAC